MSIEHLRPTMWKPGISGRTAGRYTSKASPTYWLRQFGQMTAKELGGLLGNWGKQLEAFADTEVPVIALVAARALTSQINEPDGKILALILDRLDGKQPTTIRTWKDEVIELLAAGRITPDILIDELGFDIAADLAARAGVPMLPAPQADAPTARQVDGADVPTQPPDQQADAPPSQQVIDQSSPRTDDLT